MQQKSSGIIPRAFLLITLSDDIRHECHEARALHCFGQSTLVRCRQAGAAPREDLPVRVDEFLEHFDIFVVDALELCYVIIFWHLI